MDRAFACLLATCAALTGGCMLDRTGLNRGPDGAVDAGESDAGERDAAPVDAARSDAGGPVDASADGGPPCVTGSEICNGRDDDCDPSTPDGADDPMLGTACDASEDADSCSDDTFVCASGALVCVDDGASVDEVDCNGGDDDCDGSVDESSSTCSSGHCARRERAGRSYLFCHDSAVLADWDAARVTCQTMGYDLAIIDDASENAWVHDNAVAVDGDQRWWIGLSDRSVEGTYVWAASGAAAGYVNWNGGDNPQPNDDIRLAEEDWVFLESNGMGTWFDHFAQALHFVCEAS